YARLSSLAADLLEETGRDQLDSETAAIQVSMAQAEAQTLSNAKLLANSPGLIDAVMTRDLNIVRTIVLTTAAAATFDKIDVVDASGQSLLPPAARAASAAGSEDMLRLGLLGIETTGVVAGGRASTPVLSAVTPLRDTQGALVGALVAGVALDDAFLSTLSRGRDDIHLAVIHQNELVSTSTGQHETLTVSARLVEEARSRWMPAVGGVEDDGSGIPHIQAVIPLGSRRTANDTFIAASVDLERLSSFQSQVVLVTMMLTTVASFSLAGLLGFAVWRSISIPLRRLQNVAVAMAEGDYNQRFYVRGLDEVGRLGRAFNTMAGAIRLRDRSLIEINETLEKRVRDRTQQLELATREAREANRLKDEFLAIMSHELRTPLNAIIGFQGIMEMMGDLSEKNVQRVKRTRANAERLLHLIDDILDISRIESGRLQLVPSEIEIRDLVDGLRTQMDVLAAEKSLLFRVEIDDNVPETIWIDEDAITKIITNLLGNAFKFTHKGEVGLHVGREDDTLLIHVYDSGIGIPAHMQEIIFERFRQVDGSTKREYGGSGLGLAITRQLCSALGGSVRVESVPNEGATFIATLPLALRPDPAIEQPITKPLSVL
ncbi:MAG: HAMP domain-containing protein, partial [Chloroflexi bacterium]|nr:HAMP domain-containing protein [Chloroflexota bacterium]